MKIQHVVVTGQHAVELQEAKLDCRLGPDDILIQTEATFISTGTELANYSGREPRVFQAGQWCTYPWKSGYANVGRVVDVGPSVTRASVGQRVFTYGNHASAVIYNQQRLVIPVPEEYPADLAAVSRMAGVAMTSVIVSEILGTPWVAIFGLGMVGNLAAQAFRARGCRVIGVDPVEERCALAQRCGIEWTVSGSPERALDAIREITGGHGADITVDAVGHSSVVQQAAAATARFGQVIILGTPRTPVEGDLTPLLSDIHLRFLTLRGALEWLLPMYPDAIYAQGGSLMSQYSKQAMIFEWMRRGLLQLEPLVSHRMRPWEIKTAYDGLLYEPDRYTGVVLCWPN